MVKKKVVESLIDEWLRLEEDAGVSRDKADEALSRAKLNSELPEKLRPANSRDIVVGAIIWYPDGEYEEEDEEGNLYSYIRWEFVEEVLWPDDDFKAYVSDGCRYGLKDAFVEVK
jgi:hypothetical protein